MFVFVANIGDAKAVVARSSMPDSLHIISDGLRTVKAIVLTREHKAIYPQERARIQKAGGFVSSNGRLQGRLEVSRAFGDRQFKKFILISANRDGYPAPSPAVAAVLCIGRDICQNKEFTTVVKASWTLSYSLLLAGLEPFHREAAGTTRTCSSHVPLKTRLSRIPIQSDQR
ncbi:unnamed protein product [Ilex paraguariensis]|uniref:PPM-type phosphatase domain-containing protein n=1 Tax=Ilex paraguariensis TaxID=185542 RepID=A0ABC8RCJ1_9AQUA